MAKIYGIRCTLPPKDRVKVKAVFDRIRQRYPEDFKEIKRLVRAIEPYDGYKENCAGLWRPDLDVDLDEDFQAVSGGRCPGIIQLRVSDPATIAHELGHAMTSYEDKRERDAPTEEWASELAADWYAFKWGFGREIGASRKLLSFVHHCVGPNSWVELSLDGKTRRWRVTRNFHMKLLFEKEATPFSDEEMSAIFSGTTT